MGYGVRVSAHWTKSGSLLTSDSRVRVGEEAVEVSPLVYSTSLVFSGLDKARGDEGVYVCNATVTPLGSVFYSAVTTTQSKIITVTSE